MVMAGLMILWLSSVCSLALPQQDKPTFSGVLEMQAVFFPTSSVIMLLSLNLIFFDSTFPPKHKFQIYLSIYFFLNFHGVRTCSCLLK